jgi:hypothetical protein
MVVSVEEKSRQRIVAGVTQRDERKRTERPTRPQVLRGESPLLSIARFGRLAYPGHGEVTNREVLGRKSHSRLG